MDRPIKSGNDFISWVRDIMEEIFNNTPLNPCMFEDVIETL